MAGLVAVIAAQMQQQSASVEGEAAIVEAEGAEATPPPPPPPPRENAVLVLGATGRLGRRVVQKLLASGRTVVAGVRSLDKARDVLLGSGEGRMGLAEGFQAEGRPGILFLEEVDITSPESIRRPGLWAGVSQAVLTVGTVFGPLPEGGFGVIGGMTSEKVEAEGISSLMSLLPELLPKRAERTSKMVLSMRTAEELAVWQRLDDVIMGGNSDSGLEALPEGAEVAGAVWRGNLVVEGGGFCGARTAKLGLSLADSDGVHLRLKGDGQTFKLNIKTTFELRRNEAPESKGKRPMGQRDYVRLFLKLAEDKYRWRMGLLPMPKAVPPPPPVTEERRKEIVAQVAVIRGQAPAAPAPSDGANGSAALANKNGAEKEEVKAEAKKETVGARA
ncbi:hypothetical protein GPECTOR_10g1050 [Gonium pectorale]|uniref:NADH:ubiquinone oxidoreductase intermediate-associated protein 30 domain-containing protein n=1 Tax=Gonium pectorale TaxID=33097 RepID=A0A150GQB0_GONPE|nr:hypothetical protein GPECTOR_10g1050 [Gonium pectorale]|eukprot:KXZ52027.1 hypothetical protein GPECTOR_10g1050 [Gonium pectorale]